MIYTDLYIWLLHNVSEKNYPFIRLENFHVIRRRKHLSNVMLRYVLIKFNLKQTVEDKFAFWININCRRGIYHARSVTVLNLVAICVRNKLQPHFLHIEINRRIPCYINAPMNGSLCYINAPMNDGLSVTIIPIILHCPCTLDRTRSSNRQVGRNNIALQNKSHVTICPLFFAITID